jgi:hypothetical protein
MMMTASRTEKEQHPVVAALDDLIASYDRAVRAFHDYGLQGEVDALLPDRELLIVLRSRVGFLKKQDPPA